MSDAASKRVLLIGWDAADWKVINPLLDAGKMPNLEKLINGGVMGNLATLYPELSPMLWTSIATGKRPFKHGIHGFTEPDPHGGGIRPITNLSRKTKAVWNILCQTGRKCNVVGWWPSHPSEPIDGVMVSNHYQKIAGPIDKPWPMRPGTVHPPRLAEKLAQLRLHPQELSAEHIGPFVPDFGKIDQEKDHRLESLAKIICECTSIHAAATALIQLEPWDFMAVYYDAIDHFGHGFMRFHPPRQPWVPEADFEIYQNVVESGYRYHDMMLGVLRGLAGEDTTVILISDHGFHPDHLRPQHIPNEPAGPAAQHRHYGIVVMSGPGIRKDERVYGASLLDVCPTILTLYGLPIGADMDGKALVNVFEQPPAIESVPSWDDVAGEHGMHPPGRVIDPVEAREAINQLVALGYIEKPDDNREKAVANTVRELHYNLARSYMDAARHADAANLLEGLLEKWPDELRFGIQLVVCYQALERVPEARRVLEELFKHKRELAKDVVEKLKAFREEHKDTKAEDLTDEQKKELRDLRSAAGRNPYAMEYLMGSLLFAEGDDDGSLKHLRRAQKADAKRPGLHVKIGQVYLRMKRWADATGSFEKALEIDPDDAAAHLGLARSWLGRRRAPKAAESALHAVGLIYHNPQGHYLLGIALHRLGRIEQAVEALQVAIAQNPNYADAHKRLAYVYDRRLDNPEAAHEHRRLAREARQRVRDIKAGRLKPVAATARAPEDDVAVAPPGEAPEMLEAGPVDIAETVIIVSGLPRSGTSMMMQMLEAGGLPPLTDGVREADDDNVRGYYEFERAKSVHKDASWLPEAKGKAVKIVAQLLGALPPKKDLIYRVVFMERDLGEVLASQGKMLERQGEKGADLSDDGLRNVFAGQVRRIRELLSARRIPTLCVGHQDCINQPAEVAARLNAFFGGHLDEAAMATAVDPKLYRQRHAGT